MVLIEMELLRETLTDEEQQKAWTPFEAKVVV